ncbi:hypothetical protein B0H17DRAFT_1143340 [Mycena rosella]|uniref:Uncharacterized protein n=1 Tax=Mycena rosella TaxID=1033263 RepID=A0AAD7CV93_MYCRO|nr:hypothetical protein B0H17DRAFT_1143340 [Mycena rosella]
MGNVAQGFICPGDEEEAKLPGQPWHRYEQACQVSVLSRRVELPSDLYPFGMIAELFGSLVGAPRVRCLPGGANDKQTVFKRFKWLGPEGCQIFFLSVSDWSRLPSITQYLAPGRSVSAASGFRRCFPSPPVQLNRREYSPPPRSNRRSRSRSPFRRLMRSRSRSPKRFRAAEEPEPEASIKMGPITLALTLNANTTEIFKLHMGTVFPKYSLPSDFRAKREGNYLTIILPTMGHASDLCRA